MKVKTKDLIKRSDKIWPKIVKRIGQCERCGKTSSLQAAHILSRSYYGTRGLIENGVCLCAGCHLFWAHKEADQWVDWVREKYGSDVYDDLRKKAEEYGKMTSSQKNDYQQEVLNTLKRVMEFSE